MEPKFQSSFIPKGPLAPAGNFTQKSKPKSGSFLGSLIVLIFIVVVLLSAGLFAYNWYLSNNIKKMGNDLESAKLALNSETIDSLSRLDARLNITEGLLEKHIALSPFFEFLEASTLQNVSFNDFNYAHTENGIEITMKGLARGYSAVALQADIFNKSDFLQDPLFSDLNLDERGNVTFELEAIINPSLLKYANDEIPARVSAPVNISTSTPASFGTTTATTTPNSSGTSTNPR